MNEQTAIDLTAIMRAEGIKKIEDYGAGFFLVLLKDGRCGSGNSVGEALAKAKQPEAMNVRKAA